MTIFKRLCLSMLLFAAATTYCYADDVNDLCRRQSNCEARFLRVMTGTHTSNVSETLITPDGRELLTISEKDNVIRVWDIKKGKEVRQISGYSNQQIIAHEVGDFLTMALSPDGQYLAVSPIFLFWGLYNPDKVKQHIKAIRLYDYKSGKLLKLLVHHKESVKDLTFTSDGKYLLSKAGGEIAVWETKDFTQVKQLPAHIFAISDLAGELPKKEDYQWLTAFTDMAHMRKTFNDLNLAGDMIYRLGIYSLRNREQFANIMHGVGFWHSKRNGLFNIDYDLDKNRLFVYDRKLQKVGEIPYAKRPSFMSFTPDGSRLFLFFKGKQSALDVMVYDATKPNFPELSRHSWDYPSEYIRFIDADTVISAEGPKQNIYFREATTGKLKGQIIGNADIVGKVGYDKGRLLLDYGAGKNKDKKGGMRTVKAFTPSLLTLTDLPESEAQTAAAALKPLPLTYKDYTLTFDEEQTKLRLKKSGELKAVIKLTNPQTHAGFVGKGLIVTHDVNGMITVFDLTGKVNAYLYGHTSPITSLGGFGGEGKLLLSASRDRTVRIWQTHRCEFDPSVSWHYESILVTDIVKDSDAERAGLKQGDRILKVDGNKINSGEFFLEYTQAQRTYEMRVRRNDEPLTIKINKTGKAMGIYFALAREESRYTYGIGYIPPDLTLFVNKDNEWVIWRKRIMDALWPDSDSFDEGKDTEITYAASPGGHHLLQWQVNQGLDKEAQLLPLEKDKHYKPELIKEWLENMFSEQKF